MIIQAPVKIKTLDRETTNIRPAVAPAVAIEVLDLRKSFRSGFLRRHIRGIEGVSFSVPRGSVFALIGHNGAGKTTTINCILDLVHADGGEVSIMGKDHHDPDSRARVGYLPEQPYFFEHLTGRELLQLFARLLGMPKSRRAARIDEVLELVGMTASAGCRLKKFSKGMLQRIGLAQAVLGNPDLLILDEPMSGLDPLGRRDVRELLMDLKRAGTTIILSSHIVPDVELIADTVGILKEGRLVAVRDLTELNHAFSYFVDLGLGAASPSWLPQNHRSLGGGQVRVQVDSLVGLRNLLNECHREAIPVSSLETNRSCLEELFMEINREASVEREVVR